MAGGTARRGSVQQPVRIGVLRLMLLRAAERRASQSETSRSYCSANQVDINN